MNPHFAVTAGDINIFHARLLADQQVTYVVEFSSHLDTTRLDRALAVLSKALPILGTVIRVRGTHFERVAASGWTLAATVVEPADTNCELQRFVATPCDPEHEPPLKVGLLRKSGRDTLLVKVDHCLSDAAGLHYLLLLLAEAYTTGTIQMPINRDRGLGQIFQSCSPLGLLRAARQPALPKPGPALMPLSNSTGPTFIEQRCLDPQEFAALKVRAAALGATLNDVFLAAAYQAVFQYLPHDYDQPYPIMVPVDMRRYLPPQRRGGPANLSSAVYPQLAAVPGESFSQTLGRVSLCMSGFKHQQPGLTALELMAVGGLLGGWLIRRRYQSAGAGSRFINCTNFGVIDAARLIFAEVSIENAYGIGPLQTAPGILNAISTYRNCLHWVIQGRGGSACQQFIRDFLTGIFATLHDFATQPTQIL